jgi:UDP-N-acetylmuramyl pentapeptide phosphotransferase/UDP-N-acetylglucosamine-1-phosphate transferase
LAILTAILLTWLIMAITSVLAADMIWIGAGAITVSAISFLDDRLTIHPAYRLIIHAAVAGMLVYAGFYLPVLELPGMVLRWPEAVGMVISLLFVIWMINLYNFMDGIDGLAAGMAVIGFGFLAIIGWLAGDLQYALASLIVTGAAAGFLLSNFPPARIFMGDAGSSLFGFLAAAMALWGSRRNVFPIWVAVLIFSPFIVDATITLVRRFLCREKVWRAHKSHYYQRLVQLGWSHKKTAAWEYILMMACGLSALWSTGHSPTLRWFVLGAWALIYGFLIYLVSRLEAR